MTTTAQEPAPAEFDVPALRIAMREALTHALVLQKTDAFDAKVYTLASVRKHFTDERVFRVLRNAENDGKLVEFISTLAESLPVESIIDFGVWAMNFSGDTRSKTAQLLAAGHRPIVRTPLLAHYIETRLAFSLERAANIKATTI